MCDSPKLGLFVFCERVREEATHWERLHEDALKGKIQAQTEKERGTLAGGTNKLL